MTTRKDVELLEMLANAFYQRACDGEVISSAMDIADVINDLKNELEEQMEQGDTNVGS